jgi:hypothetical protein
VSTTVLVRLFIEGKLCDETSLELGAEMDDLLGEVGRRHGDMASAAASEGLAWMIEFVFPDGDHVRWGTDPDGMVLPVPIADLEAALLRRYEG